MVAADVGVEGVAVVVTGVGVEGGTAAVGERISNARYRSLPDKF